MTSSSVRSEDRRALPRKAAVLAVGLESARKDGRHGVTRDISARGLLVVTPSQFAKGERLRITVHGDDGDMDLLGRVTRVDENPVSSPELWRYRLGIELDEPLPFALDSEVRPVAKA